MKFPTLNIRRFLGAAVLPIALLVGMGGCKTITSPGATSTFAGRIVLFDSTGYTMNDFSGATVQFDNTSFTTTTNADGSWEIDNVPEGQYDVSATKAGFGTFHWYEQIVNGGRNDLSTAAIARVPNIALNVSGPTIGGGVLYLGGYDTGQHTIHYAIAQYVDIDSTVQPSASHVAAAAGEEYISLDDLRAAGAQPGQTLFISYAWVFDSSGDLDGGHYQYSFYDSRHNETRYASNGPKSKVFTVTMPQ